MIRGEWIELNVGSFRMVKGETGEECFDLYKHGGHPENRELYFGLCEHGGHWKTGLIIKGVILRARN
ncbi:hypothetical protein PVL29_019399 [Vitis rotundifolia]|uniref:Uncharacterized protein n=1 Tax=Vitis rotundifolia TaxID=103349 RepID=A0AA38Z0G4_VITRO|nr:hypothetical protein PVL29_019399 [Vitis rotundifolia]